MMWLSNLFKIASIPLELEQLGQPVIAVNGNAILLYHVSARFNAHFYVISHV